MPYVELSDLRCFFEVRGTGDPLLLIPGLGATNTVWGPAADELAKSFSLILPDNRDVGRSVATRPPRSISDFSVDMVELLDALGMERAHVLGLSLGGIVAQQFAVDHPSRVDRLVLMSCAHRLGPYLIGMAGLLGHALRYFPPAVFQRTMELLGTSPEFLDAHPNAIEEQIEIARRRNVARTAVARQLRCIGVSQIAPQDYHISAPTLIIAGERDGVIPSCCGREMAADIPGSRFEQVPACGHNPLQERPEIVVPMIADFLQAPWPGNRMHHHKDTQVFTEELN
jgi:pimeloyl-ACP methyl ester carboxylesterase